MFSNNTTVSKLTSDINSGATGILNVDVLTYKIGNINDVGNKIVIKQLDDNTVSFIDNTESFLSMLKNDIENIPLSEIIELYLSNELINKLTKQNISIRIGILNSYIPIRDKYMQLAYQIESGTIDKVSIRGFTYRIATILGEHNYRIILYDTYNCVCFVKKDYILQFIKGDDSLLDHNNWFNRTDNFKYVFYQIHKK